jgi:CPA2 family monovalent cation:H+ antiporter-2
MHDLPVIATIAAGFTAAWALGLLTQRLGLSPIVGYLLAGVLIGPHTPGFVGDIEIAHQLAEVGVILLMFGVGIHFHVKDLLAVRNVAIPGAVVQSAVATVLAVVVFSAFDVPALNAAVLGMAMAVASTVVLMRMLSDAGVLETPQGHIAVGWLIVEDIFTVVLLVLIPVLGQQGAASGMGSLWTAMGMALLKMLALILVVVVGGSRLIPWVLQRVAGLRSRELFTLTVLVFSIAIAAGAYYLFGASMALGAFLAGMVVAQSPVSHQAAADALPMRDAFAVIFFVSVGMLFDPAFLVQSPLMVLAALAIILVAKPLAALLIVTLLGYSVRTGLTVAVGLAQIGEFSFILAELGRVHGLVGDEGRNVLVASAILSIMLNPLLFRSLPRVESILRRRPRLWKLLNHRAERRANRLNETALQRVPVEPGVGLAVVVGYGPVGRSVNRLLRDARLSTVVVDLNTDTVADLNASGQTALFGDAANETILRQAGIEHASHLIVTVPSSADRSAVIATARVLNPNTRILARARYLGEREEMERAGVAGAVFEEAEAAVALARLVLADTGVHREAAEEKVRDLRLQLVRENLSNIRTQRVRSIMVPWNRVQWLPSDASKEMVLRRISQERFSRWPVVDPKTGETTGYLLTKDLIADASAGHDWTKLVRPLHTVRSEDDIESTLTRMQVEGSSVYVVEGDDGPLGFVTLEDILEQVVGRIEDEYPHDAGLSLSSTVAAGGLVLDLRGGTPEQVIRELAGSIPPNKIPPNTDIAALALARESALSTDLGIGVAVPHARCAGLRVPLIAFGRSREGVLFSLESHEVVRLIFLLVTPEERPDTHLSLLANVASVVRDPHVRDRLLKASSPPEVLEILAQASARTAHAAS